MTGQKSAGALNVLRMSLIAEYGLQGLFSNLLFIIITSFVLSIM